MCVCLGLRCEVNRQSSLVWVNSNNTTTIGRRKKKKANTQHTLLVINKFFPSRFIPTFRSCWKHSKVHFHLMFCSLYITLTFPNKVLLYPLPLSSSCSTLPFIFLSSSLLSVYIFHSTVNNQMSLSEHVHFKSDLFAVLFLKNRFALIIHQTSDIFQMWLRSTTFKKKTFSCFDSECWLKSFPFSAFVCGCSLHRKVHVCYSFI